jgi:hypothetical protein
MMTISIQLGGKRKEANGVLLSEMSSDSLVLPLLPSNWTIGHERRHNLREWKEQSFSRICPLFKFVHRTGEQLGNGGESGNFKSWEKVISFKVFRGGKIWRKQEQLNSSNNVAIVVTR